MSTIRLLFLAAGILAIGCSDPAPKDASSTGDGTGGGTEAGGGTQGDTGTTNGGTDGTADGTTTGADPIDIPAVSLVTSYVSADSYSGLGGENSTVIAAFYVQVPDPFEVTLETFGDCQVRVVTFGDGTSSLDAHGAGTVHVEGGSEAVKVLSHDGSNYTAWTGDFALFTGGEELTVKADGAAIAAWQTTLTAPAHVTVTEPVPIIGQPLAAEAGANLVVGWDGETAGVVRVRISGPQNLPNPQTIIQCDFDSTPGTGKVPAAALAKVVEPGTGTLAVDSVNTVVVDVPGWGTVDVSATARGLRAAGTPYLTTISF